MLTIFWQDNLREDDDYVFVPALRRSLRLSASARCAPLFGSDLRFSLTHNVHHHSNQPLRSKAAGWSPLGPLALYIQAPDEGNTNPLNQVATPAQKERWLGPLVRGEIYTVFLMTEPDGGAGSDPMLMKTTARAMVRGGRSGGLRIFAGTKVGLFS